MSQPVRVTLREVAALADCDSTTVATINDSSIELQRGAAEVDWHVHPDEDKGLLVLSGVVRIAYRIGAEERELSLTPGELFVIPQGIEHRTASEPETELVLFGRKKTGHPSRA